VTYYKELQKEFTSKDTPGPGEYNSEKKFKPKMGKIMPINRSAWVSRTEWPDVQKPQDLDDQA